MKYAVKRRRTSRRYENKIIQGVGMKYPQLIHSLRALQRPRRANCSDYASAKAILNRYVLDTREYEACIYIITERLRI